MNQKIISLLALSLLTAPLALAQNSTPPPQISLSGSAEVKVAPDEIMLSVGVETRAETLEPARVENDEKVAAILAFLKASQIADKDVQMDYINVQPDYYYNNNSSASHIKPVAYVVRKNLEIRLTNTTNFQGVLTGLLTNGVNYVNNIDFRTTQLRKYRDQARAMAIRAAKEKAEALTGELGAKLGKVINISTYDNGGYYSGYWGNNRAFNGFNGMSQSSSGGEGGGGGGAASDAATDMFAVGQISVNATVNVSFLIR